MQDSPTGSESLPLLLIDESLPDRPLAEALRLVDYNAIGVTEQFGQSVEDPVIIQWLGLQGGIWVTADEKAKYQHATEIKGTGIHIVWIRRPKEGMSKKSHLLLLLSVLDRVLDDITRARRPAYFSARFTGGRPKLDRLQ